MNKPIARKDSIVVQKIEDETLVYDVDENKAFCLNETSALVWELCDGRQDVSEISNEMSARLKTRISEEFVHLALDGLNEVDLLDFADFNFFGGFSRREVIRKVGFASAASLPIISSIVAPTALMAQSSGNQPFGSACGAHSECASGNCLSVIGTVSAICCAAGTGFSLDPILGLPQIIGPNQFLASGGGCSQDEPLCLSEAATKCCSGSASISPHSFCDLNGGLGCVCS